MFNVESSSDASCHRTDQFIRAQVQKQSPKRSNSRTWAHINPVVNRNLEGFQTNLHTTKITVIQHNISYVTTFRIRSQIGYIITESLLLQNKSCKHAEANSLTHTPSSNTHTGLLITDRKSIQIRERRSCPWSSPHHPPGGDNTCRIPDIGGHLQQEGINPEYGNVLS